MIRLENISKTDLQNIANTIAESFLCEDGMITRSLNLREASAYFDIMISEAYRVNSLYATSEKQEGYCIYWHKGKGPSTWREILAFFTYMKRIPMYKLSNLVVSHHDWTDYEMQFQNEKDYLDVYLVVVRKEYQGQGFFRKMMEELMDIARQDHVIMILDTDSELKAQKYMHVGMEVVTEKVLESGLHMYTLKYDILDS